MSAFPDRPDCPLPPVPPIPDDLIVTCDVTPAPDPIYQSPLLPPIEIPAPPGCADIITNVEITQDPTEDPKFEIDIEYRDDDFCFPEWNFDINFPCDCVVFSEGEVNVQGGTAVIEFEQVIDPEDPCNCEYKFNFDLDIDAASPCEIIKPGTASGEVTVAEAGEPAGVSGNIRLLTTTGVFWPSQSEGPYNNITVGVEYPPPTYTGPSNTYYIEVVTGGDPSSTDLKVTTTNGEDEVPSLTPSEFGVPTEIGTRGVAIIFLTNGFGSATPQNEFITGQTWAVAVTELDDNGCALDLDLQIKVPNSLCESGKLLNEAPEVIPMGGCIQVTGIVGEVLRGTKPTKDNMLNVVVALDPIEPGEEGPIVYDSSGGCGESPKVLIDGEVEEGDLIGTVADSWKMKKGNKGFIAMANDSGSSLFKQGGETGSRAFIINFDEAGAEECPKGGAIQVIARTPIGEIEFLGGHKPEEDNLSNAVIALEPIPPGEAGPVAYNSFDRYGDIIPTALYNGIPEDGGPMGTEKDSWELKIGNWGFTYVGGGEGGALFRSGNYTKVLFGSVSIPPEAGTATIDLYKVEDDGTKTDLEISIPGVIPKE